MADRRELGAPHAYMHNKSKKLYVVSVRADRKGGTQAEAVLALTTPAPVHAHKPSPSPSDLWSDTAKLEHLHYSHLLEGTVVALHPNGLQPAAREEHAQLTGGLPATTCASVLVGMWTVREGLASQPMCSPQYRATGGGHVVSWCCLGGMRGKPWKDQTENGTDKPLNTYSESTDETTTSLTTQPHTICPLSLPPPLPQLLPPLFPLTLLQWPS